MEETLRNFLLSLIDIGLKVLLVISVVDQAGIETTSFIALLGAAGLAIGLAMQGALANFAGGEAQQAVHRADADSGGNRSNGFSQGLHRIRSQVVVNRTA